MAALQPGDSAPDFALPDQTGKTVKCSDFVGKRLLLFFYPKADTPGCTRQACSVRDATADLLDLGVAAVGISPDPPEKQQKFRAKHQLAYRLLSDVEHRVADQYGAWGEKKLYGKTSMGIIRSAVLVGEDGKILGVWYKVKPEDTVPKALKMLEGLPPVAASPEPAAESQAVPEKPKKPRTRKTTKPKE
jgi:thioredoxin-dependent peroxiredoxin